MSVGSEEVKSDALVGSDELVQQNVVCATTYMRYSNLPGSESAMLRAELAIGKVRR